MGSFPVDPAVNDGRQVLDAIDQVHVVESEVHVADPTVQRGIREAISQPFTESDR
jgi:hypothetical protein